jgi:hypothetical protein
MIFRTVFIIVLGVLITPLAGYIGALTSPIASLIWFVVTLFAFASAFKVGIAALVAPAFVGAAYAWPVICVLFPALALILRRTNGWTPFIFLAAGAVGGTIRMVEVGYSRGPQFGPVPNEIAAGAVAGALLGCLYGFVLWRFDVIRAFKTRPAE